MLIGRRDATASIILITGGCGFIGANLVEHLRGKGGYRLRILDNLATGRREYLDHALGPSCLSGAGELIVGDVRNEQQVEEAVRGVAGVVHLAAHTSVVDSLEDPIHDFGVNAQGTLNLLEACRAHGIERFVYASSNAVVGEQRPPIDERKVPTPLSPYGASKLVGEALCSAYYHSFGIKAISLRFANVYGPYSEHKPSVIAEFIRRARAGRPLVIYGDGGQTRDFIHARDICRAVDLALHFDPSRSTSSMNLVFQIATGVETRIIDLAGLIRKLSIQSGRAPLELVFEEARAGEIRRNYADISLAGEVLGFHPEVGLARGLRAVWEHAQGSP